MKPNPEYLPTYYKGYVSLLGNQPLITAMEQSKATAIQLLKTIDEDQGAYAYDTGKWTIKELINHMMDTERVFAYRALSFARNDHAELPGFEENEWVVSSKANNQSMEHLVGQYEQLSASTVMLFKSFDSDMLNHVGTANGAQFNVTNIGFIIAGHETHHLNILKERYLNQLG